MKVQLLMIAVICAALFSVGCSSDTPLDTDDLSGVSDNDVSAFRSERQEQEVGDSQTENKENDDVYTRDTPIDDVIGDEVFGDHGRLIFPAEKACGLGHGFGLGTGTSADGWINDAAAFRERQMKR